MATATLPAVQTNNASGALTRLEENLKERDARLEEGLALVRVSSEAATNQLLRIREEFLDPSIADAGTLPSSELQAKLGRLLGEEVRAWDTLVRAITNRPVVIAMAKAEMKRMSAPEELQEQYAAAKAREADETVHMLVKALRDILAKERKVIADVRVFLRIPSRKEAA